MLAFRKFNYPIWPYSDPSSLLGVRLPPDTEIIKYTSSIVGPKIPGTTNRGRKKTISLDPNPLLAGIPGLTAGTGVSPAKRARLEAEYGLVQQHHHQQQQHQQQQSHQSQQQSHQQQSHHQQMAAHQSDRVEVIKLPPTINSNGAYNLSKSGVSAAAAAAAAAAAVSSHNKDTSLDSSNEWATGLNLSGKASTSSTITEDGDAPLNLCMKSSDKSAGGNSGSGGAATTGSVGMDLSGGGTAGSVTNSLQSLSSITAALGSGSGNDRTFNLVFTRLIFN